MRIAFLSPGPIGPDSRAAREIRTLRDAGHDVTAIELARLTAAAGRLVRARADVVHAHGARALAIGRFAGRVLGGELVYDALAADARSPLAAWAERLLVGSSAVVLADSSAAALRVRERSRTGAAPVVVRDLPDVPRQGVKAGGLRERLGIGDAPIVLQDARGERRGFETLVRVLSTQRGVHLVALCDAPDSDGLRLFADRHRMGGRVHVIKPVGGQRLVSLAADADAAACLPDDSSDGRMRPSPPRLLRYVVAGRPVITERGACDDLPDAAGVLLVRPQDEADVARALGAALDGPRPHATEASAGWRAEAPKLEGAYGRPGAVAGLRARRRWLQKALRAVQGIRAGTSRHPGAAMSFAKGRRLRAAGRPAEAAPQLASAARLDPGNAQYWLHWGAALRDSGAAEEAVRAYRQALALSGDGDRDPVLANAAAVALHRLGVRAEPEALLRDLEGRADKAPRDWLRIAELRSAALDVRGALAALERADGASAERDLRTRLRVLEQCGQFTPALEVAEAIGDAQACERLRGTLRGFDTTWRPPAERRNGRAVPGTDPVVLHLLETSLPYATSGYTYRTSTVFGLQQRAGLRPVAATRLGFPANRGVPSHSAIELVDGVVHHFFTLPGVTHYTSIPADERLRLNVELLEGLVEKVRPIALHATSPHFNGLLGLALRDAFDIPLVYEARGFPEMTWAVRSGGGDSESYALRRAAETRCMLEADAVITLSQVMREHIVGRGVPADRVFVVPHIVDTVRFAPREKDLGLARRYGLEGKAVAGYVSSLVDYEGVDVLLRAIAAARESDPSVAGLIVGDGLALPSLRALAVELGLEGAVAFTGRVPHAETVDHYALIDMFVVPRRGLEVCAHVTPLKPFEAMAMGRCVVVSDLPALAETVGGGDHGRRFTPDDPAGLARELVELAGDPELRAELGARARAFVERAHGPALDAGITSRPFRFAREPLPAG